MTNNIMQAAVLTRYGAPENIEVTTTTRPTPKANEVLVKVFATPVTTADTMMRRADPAIARLILGFTRPRNNIMGTGFAGKVVAMGADVQDFAVGDRVYGESGIGFSANAEYVCVAQDATIDWAPLAMSYEEAATLCDGPLTSYHFLKTLGQVGAGHSVLIIGASGSLGTAAVQIAVALGARVTGVCSNRNVELVKSLGAEAVIEYTQTEVTQTDGTYDVIFDTISATSFSSTRHLLGAEGIYLSPVLKFSLLLEMLYTRFFSMRKAEFAAVGMLPPQQHQEYLKQINLLISQRKLKVVIDRKYPLAEAVSAHRYVDTGRKRGNVVLTVVDTQASSSTDTLISLT